MQGENDGVTIDVEMVEGVEFAYMIVAQVPHPQQGIMVLAKEVSEFYFKKVNEQIRAGKKLILMETLDNPGIPLILNMDMCFMVTTDKQEKKTASNLIIARQMPKN